MYERCWGRKHHGKSKNQSYVHSSSTRGCRWDHLTWRGLTFDWRPYYLWLALTKIIWLALSKPYFTYPHLSLLYTFYYSQCPKVLIWISWGKSLSSVITTGLRGQQKDDLIALSATLAGRFLKKWSVKWCYRSVNTTSCFCSLWLGILREK